MTDAGTAVPLLSVEHLSVEFRTRDGIVRALEDVSFSVARGEMLGLVGESGSGKSVTALSIMGILHPAARISAGRAVFDGVDLVAASEREREQHRGRKLSMIFQNPRMALNPIRQVGLQIEDVLLRHTDLSRTQARARALELLAQVQIADPERTWGSYPFELSGGMCQRVMIALAIACSPAILIADEPTTGLDVCTQATILELLEDIARRNRMATVLVTHDLALVAERCDRIVVMHAGHMVETAPTRLLFSRPRHPYTQRLIASIPRAGAKLADLAPVPGSVPDLRRNLPPCRYRQRCDRGASACDQAPLPRRELGAGQIVACHFPL